MRLIDIDKHFELNEPFYRADIEMPLHRVKVALESLPTVEAIPVEWIRRQKMESNLNVIDYALGVIDGHNCCIDMLIRKWEKENGKC